MPARDCDWFESDDDELNDSAVRFAAVLRRRAAGWPMSPCNTVIYPPAGDRPAIAYLDLTVPGLNLVLLTAGVHLFTDRISADQVHNQSFDLPDHLTPLAMHATGEPDVLGELAATWFESIIDRSVVHCVWEHAGVVYAERYQFTDGYPLSNRYDSDLAPAGQPEQLKAAGHVHGQSWIQTTGLGAPTRVEPLPGWLR